MDEALIFVGIKDESGITLQSRRGPFNIRLLSASRLHGTGLVNLNCILDLQAQKLFFMNMNIKGRDNISMSVASNISMSVASNNLILIDTCKAFIKWLQSRAISPNWLQQVSNIISICPNLVVKHNNNYYLSDINQITNLLSPGFSQNNPVITIEQIFDQYDCGWLYCGTPDDDILEIMPDNSTILSPQPVSTDNSNLEIFNNPSQMLNAKKDKGKEVVKDPDMNN